MTPPFATAEAAWLWCAQSLIAQRENRWVETQRDPAEIVQVLDRLYRQRRVTLEHARILRIWGERNRAPDPSIPVDREDARAWAEAMRAMETPLRMKGIVA